MIGPTRICDVVSQLVTGVATAVNAAHAPGDALNRTFYQFGEVAWDDCQCGTLALTVLRRYTSREFPVDTSQQRRGNCDTGYIVADCQLSIVRCVPIVGDDSDNALATPPKTVDIQNATQKMFIDEYYAWQALSCMLNSMYDASPPQVAEYLVSDATSLGPQGGCAGTVIGFKIGFARDCACG